MKSSFNWQIQKKNKEDEHAESDDEDTAVIRVLDTRRLQVFKCREAAIVILDENDPNWERSLALKSTLLNACLAFYRKLYKMKNQTAKQITNEKIFFSSKNCCTFYIKKFV